MTSLDLTALGLLSTLASAAVKVTVVLAAATLVTRLQRRRTAALRHLIWTAALGSTVAVLFLPAVLPAWRVIPISPRLGLDDAPPMRAAGVVSLAGPRVLSAADSRSIIPGEGESLERAASRHIASGEQPTPPGYVPGDLGWPRWLAGLWLLGALVLVGRHIRGRLTLSQLSHAGATEEACLLLVEQTAQRMRIGRPVALRNSDRVDVPITWGILRPQIVFPADAAEWTVERRRHVLQHELAHIRRFDAGTQLIAQAASTIFWFHPWVWYAVGQMRCESERACDDQVLSAGAVAAEYASDLLAFVTVAATVERHTAALAFARRSQLEGRLLALLDPRVERTVLSRRRVVAVLVTATVAIIPLAAAQRAEARAVSSGSVAGEMTGLPSVTTSRALRARTTVGAPRPRANASGPAAPASPREPTGLADRVVDDGIALVADPLVVDQDLFAGCASRVWNHNSDGSGSGVMRTWTANGSTSDCRFTLEAEGDIQFDRGAMAIGHLSPAGTIDIMTNIRGDVSRLVVRASAIGDLAYEFSRNGQRVEYGADGQTWLAQFLLGLDRTTAFAIDQRFPLLLQTGGPAAVLAEIDRMYGNYARRTYLIRLIRSAPLDSALVRRTAIAAVTIPAGHDVADLIIALTNRYPFADSVSRAPLLRGALALRDDHDRVESVLAITRTARLSHNEAFAVVNAAARLHEDYEKSRLLLSLVGPRGFDADLRNAFVAAAESIGDARARARVLTAVGPGQ